MKLKDLLQGVTVRNVTVDMNTEITGVVYDSRKVTPGCLFVAITGFVSDGNRYISKALESGAAAVVTAVQPQEEIPYVLVHLTVWRWRKSALICIKDLQRQ